MSAPLSIDAYDAQMLDFASDPDVPMHITGSTEFFAEALMDHDVHFSASTYAEHPSVEVDMEEYVGDNAEYEMADETTEYPRSHGDELLDVEVYDASHVPSPIVPNQPLQPSVDLSIESERPVPTQAVLTEPATLPEAQGKPESEVHGAAQDHPAADASHVEPLASAEGEGAPSDAVSSESARPTDAADKSTLPASESHEQLGDVTRAVEQSFGTPAPADVADQVASHVPPVTEEHPVDSEVARQETPKPTATESAPLESAEGTYDNGSLIQDERATDQAPATDGEAVDPLHISDDVYIDPPPAVLLSIADFPQTEFVLFNQPEVDGGPAGESEGKREAYSLLLEDRPTLYYEPLTSVFEALRQDEALLSRVPHGYEGELVLDAYDLQLAISEDNVHSREINLHDLNILHDGSDFVGPLRLQLRAIAPRFILRYYALQEQIQRLNAREEEHDQDQHVQYETGEEQHLPQQAEEVASTQTAVVPDSSGVPSIVEAEEPIKEPVYHPETTEETTQEGYEPEDTSSVQEPAAEYHEVTGEATHVLEDEGDYNGTNAGDEDESVEAEDLDADQVHATTAEDTDAAATVTGHGSEFGGEQTEYLDYIQPEDYDERYGEDLPERAGGASPLQYGESPHYEEGEQDTSPAVDGTQTVLPGTDEDEDGKSAATPVPARVTLESEVSEAASNNAQQDKSIPDSEGLATSESTKEDADGEQALGNHEADLAQAKIFSKVDESDSNFVSILEREADAEFDQTFHAEQNGRGIEAALQHEPNWDEWDDEDAEGEDEEDWIDPDAASNESSITLSSKASSKRSHDEVDPSEELYVEADPDTSPGSKRPRVR